MVSPNQTLSQVNGVELRAELPYTVDPTSIYINMMISFIAIRQVPFSPQKQPDASHGGFVYR